MTSMTSNPVRGGLSRYRLEANLEGDKLLAKAWRGSGSYYEIANHFLLSFVACLVNQLRSIDLPKLRPMSLILRPP